MAVPPDSTGQFSSYVSLQEYLVDADYEALYGHFKATGQGSGRGRPCNLPPISAISNKLLLQLGMLHDAFGNQKSQKDVVDLAEKLLSVSFTVDVPRLFPLIRHAQCLVEKIGILEIDKLNKFLCKVHDYSIPKDSPHCLQLGLTKSFLLNHKDLECLPPVQVDVVSNKLVIELERFRNDQGLQKATLCEWLQLLLPGFEPTSIRAVHQKVAAAIKRRKTLLKDKKKYQELLELERWPFADRKTLLKDKKKYQELLELERCPFADLRSPGETTNTLLPQTPPVHDAGEDPTSSVCDNTDPGEQIIFQDLNEGFCEAIDEPAEGQEGLQDLTVSNTGFCEAADITADEEDGTSKVTASGNTDAGCCQIIDELQTIQPVDNGLQTLDVKPSCGHDGTRKLATSRNSNAGHQAKDELHPLQPVVNGLQELLAVKKDHITVLCSEIDELSNQVKKTLHANATITERLRGKSVECATLKKNETNVKRAALALDKSKKNLQKRNCMRLQAVTKQIKKLEASVAVCKKTEHEVRQKLQEANAAIRRLEHSQKESTQEIDQLLQQLAEGKPKCITKEDGKFTDDIQVCAGQLVGELEVSAARVAVVIQCVARHLFQTEIAAKDLPSKSTVNRYVDTAHAIGKMHICEELHKNTFDLHSDGTSREKKKYMGQQVTLSNNKSLSLGYYAISGETSQTLVDATMALITEVSSVMAEDEEQVNVAVKSILTNLTATMSDRAATMKAFNRKMEETRKEILGTEDGLEFLYCNAHFLLGLSAAAEKSLLAVEKAEGLASKLGRDLLSAFGHFKSSSTETGALRALRTACDILGPRGDEKNGCRDMWLGYCKLKDFKSRISSYRSNRFNNTFEGAAAILYHLKDIKNFLTEFGAETANLKIRSVLADLEDNNVVTMLAALGVAYICVAGPFWVMINSGVHYLDLFKPIQAMKAFLSQIVEEPEKVKVLIQEFPSTLTSFCIDNDDIVQYVKLFIQTSAIIDHQLLSKVLHSFCLTFVTVVNNQLTDFLPGGRYSTAPTDEQRQKMKHCQTSNLLGEACLGDLDFSMNKRRFASVFYHSTINIMKRNKPFSNWYPEKSTEEKKHLMGIARRKGKDLRAAHRVKEMAVVLEDKARVEARGEAKKKKEVTERARRLQIISDVGDSPISGPCLSAADVDRLLSSCTSVTAQANAIRLQLRYYRIVMNTKGSLLQFGKKSLQTIVLDLKTFLREAQGESDDHLLDGETLPVPPPTKRRRAALPAVPLQDPTNSESDLESSDYEAHDSDEETSEQELIMGGTFTQQGQRVAVFYDEMPYVGEVLKVVDHQKATVTFMRQDGQRNSFGWPSSLDLDTIDVMFVLDWDVQLVPTGKNARRWTLPNFCQIQKRWKLYKTKAELDQI